MLWIMLKDMWITAKKKFTVCLFYAAVLFGTVRIAGNWLKGFGVDGSTFFGPAFPEVKRCLISALFFIFIYMVVQELPLRICRGMFICASGERERMLYLIGQLAVKIAVSSLLLVIALPVATGGFFISGNPWIRAAQIFLFLSTLLNINLRIGIGIKGARKIDEKGYAIYSASEIAVNTNWFGFILIQNVIFYSVVLAGYEPDNRLTAGFLLLMLVLNGYYAARYLKPVLKEAMSYENVYRQEPEKEYVQTDLSGEPTYTIFRI